MFDVIIETLGVEAIMVLRRAAMLEIIIWAVMFVAVMIDMRAGIRKAKALNQHIDSHGLRRTLTKFGDYGKVTALFMCVDMLGIMFDIYLMPYASGASAVIAVSIEAWSVRENLRAARSSAAKITELIGEFIKASNEKDVSELLRKFSEMQSLLSKNNQQTSKN